MPKIFISYRRQDTEDQAGRLSASLGRHFGEHVFRDKDSIPGGVKWREHVSDVLSKDTVVLALIGKTWVTAKDASGQRLIDNVKSNNRLELEAAFRAGLKTIPVLVDGAEVPKEDDLPESLRELLAINAVRLRRDDWDDDIRKIIATVEGRRRVSGAVLWLTTVAFVATVGVAVTLYTRQSQPAPAPPTPNPTPSSPVVNDAPSFQIIVDHSEAMNARFGDGSKLDAARKALVTLLQEKTADTDNLSLREFGGECNDLKNTRLILPFAPGESRLAQELDTMTITGGKSTLVNAVVEATGDFSGRTGRSSGIIVIAGSYDGCGRPDPAGAIQQRLKRYPELTFDLRFIGVALSQQAQSSVRDLASKTGGTFRNARTPAELDDAVKQAIIVEAKVGEVQTAVEILNECATHLNTALKEHLGSRVDYSAANQEVAKAERALQQTVVPAPEPGHPEGVRELLNIARLGRDDQEKMLEATKALIAAKQAGDSDAETRARGAYNQSATAYNARKNKINELQQLLLK
jgi:hypothetical protein